MFSDSHPLLQANDDQHEDDGDVGYMYDEIVEIYSVQILDTYRGNPVNIYGTIAAHCSRPDYFYKQDRSNSKKMRPNEFLKLVDPVNPLDARDNFAIVFQLMDNDSPSPDNVLIGEAWDFAPYNKFYEYDQVLSDVVKGRHFSLALNYAVFSDAVVASVEFTFINDGGENHANIYGKILAFGSRDNTPILLFGENKDSYVDVRPLQNIPLSRSVVIVDYHSSLRIEAALWDYNSDDMIVQGQAVFDPRISGVTTKSIKSKYGDVAVKVTW